MKNERISDFISSFDRIQHNLTDRIIKPLQWVSNKILALIRELKFFQYCLKFGQRNDDVYICTFAKSGTTLMQMIVYQMTTSGEINFDHIYEVSPWIRNDAFRGKPPLNFPSPRIIKSHDPYNLFEKDTKGRFIHVMRDGKDVAASLYHQTKNYINPEAKFNETFRRSFVRRGEMNWFQYNKKWLENKRKFNILYIRYEDLLQNKLEVIKKIAEFLRIDLTNDIINRTLERSSFEFMKQHEDKFGEQPIERVYDQFIRKGKAGEGEELLDTNQKKFFQEQFDKHLSVLLKVQK